MDAYDNGACAQALNRKGIVNFGGLRVVNGIGLYSSQRQLLSNGRRFQFGKACAFGKVVKQETLPMKIVSAGNGASVLQQRKGRCLAGPAGFYHGLVFSRVFIGPEQNFVELLLNGRWALALDQVL